MTGATCTSPVNHSPAIWSTRMEPDKIVRTRPGRCEQTYEVMLRGHLKPEHLDQIEKVVDSAVGRLFVKGIQSIRHVGHKTRLTVILDEGKNRHLRRLFGALEDHEKGTVLKVLELKRVAIGELRLDVELGVWRVVTSAEERLLGLD